MATGLIGTSTADSTDTSTVTGATLSYTCPASGVRYAIVHILSSVYAFCGNTSTTAQAVSGILKVLIEFPNSSATYSTLEKTVNYSVILAPGQTWSGNTTATAGHGVGNSAGAQLQASVLEIV